MKKAIHLITFLYGICICNIFIVQHYSRATNKEAVMFIGGLGIVLLIVSYLIGLKALDKQD